MMTNTIGFTTTRPRAPKMLDTDFWILVRTKLVRFSSSLSQIFENLSGICI